MKNSATYAKELKRFFNRLKRSGPKPTTYESDEPLNHLLFAILSENNSPAKARQALTRLLASVIDYNDLRVSTPSELAAMVELDLPNAIDRTTVLVQILGAIYGRENAVTLDRFKTKSKRDTRAYLQQLEGMTAYVLAGTMLWGFGEHLIPVDAQTLEVLKKEQLTDPDADVGTAQSFLRRHISSGDARLFTALLKRHTAQRAARRSDGPSDRSSGTKKCPQC